ncbi:MAG: hypothetical protein CL666_07250 [Balneola sp.]|nr:hypothetical protein [Balneola sp.]|tara:strand:- start:79031 stop:79441 length:411 start_codon:yes stop_codon:yes gene_type:complete
MKTVHVVLLLLGFTCLQGCLNNVEDISESSDYDPSEISYSNDIQPILTQTCGGSGCHVNSSTNGVNVSSYSTLMNSSGTVYGEAVVNPGNPDDSPLVDKIEPDPRFGSRMPQGGPFLTNDEISKIRAWIKGGAEDN